MLLAIVLTCVLAYLVVALWLLPKVSHRLYVGNQGHQYRNDDWSRGYSIWVGLLVCLIWPISQSVRKVKNIMIEMERVEKEKELAEKRERWATCRYNARKRIESQLLLLAFDKQTVETLTGAKWHNQRVEYLVAELCDRFGGRLTEDRPFTKNEAYDILLPCMFTEFEGTKLDELS